MMKPDKTQNQKKQIELTKQKFLIGLAIAGAIAILPALYRVDYFTGANLSGAILLNGEMYALPNQLQQFGVLVNCLPKQIEESELATTANILPKLGCE